MRIFDEVVELVVGQRQREQCRRGEQLVACFGNDYRDVLLNEEGNARRASLPVPVLDVTCDYIEFRERL